MGRAHLFSAASGNEVGKFVRHIDAAPALLISRMAKKAVLVGTRSTASQTSSPKRKVRDDVEVIPTTRQTGSTTHARLNTQRKILLTLWTLWLTGREFDPKQFFRAQPIDV